MIASLIIRGVNSFIDAKVNSELINYYPNGFSKLNFHSNDEGVIDDDSFIFILSFGHSRNIVIRSREHKITLPRFWEKLK